MRTRSPRRATPKAPSRRRRPRLGPGLLLALALGLAFYLGRWSVAAQQEVPPTPAALAPEAVAEVCPKADPASPTAQVQTSTIGLCPCPRKKPPRILPIARRRPAPEPVADRGRADPTLATARYLRDQAGRLAPCAPSRGGELHVHLEVEVAPKGQVAKVKVTNLDPVPPEVSTCVERIYSSLTPPGFDAREPATFALTVVL